MAEREALSPAVFDAWNELWVGAALAHDRFMRVEVTERRDRGDRLLALEIPLIKTKRQRRGAAILRFKAQGSGLASS